jgi:hypothetical protein
MASRLDAKMRRAVGALITRSTSQDRKRFAASETLIAGRPMLKQSTDEPIIMSGLAEEIHAS